MKTIKNVSNQFFKNCKWCYFSPLRIIIPLFFLCILVSSCSKYENLTETTNTLATIDLKGVSMSSGHLVFTDEIAFQAAIDFLKMYQDDVTVFYEAFPGFVSADKQYEQDLEHFDNEVKNISDISNFLSMSLRTINNEIEVVPTIDAVILGYLANSEHVFQIGDIMYYFSYESTYEIPMKYVSSFKNSVEFDVANASANYPIVRTTGSGAIEDGSRAITDEFTYNYYTCAVDRRFYGNMETTDVGVYLEIRLTTKHQKKSLGIWVAEKVAYIGTMGTGKYTGPFVEDLTIYDYDVEVNKYDANDANKVISSIGGGGGDHYYFVAGECNNTHDFNKDCSGALYTNYTNY